MESSEWLLLPGLTEPASAEAPQGGRFTYPVTNLSAYLQRFAYLCLGLLCLTKSPTEVGKYVESKGLA